MFKNLFSKILDRQTVDSILEGLITIREILKELTLRNVDELASLEEQERFLRSEIKRSLRVSKKLEELFK